MIPLAVTLLVALPLLVLAISFLFKKRFAAAGRLFLIHSLAPSLLDAGSFSVRGFHLLLDRLNAFDIRVGTLAEAIESKNIAAITFDDGYDDIMQIAPYLAEKGIPIMIFIPTATIGRRNQWDNFLIAGRRQHLDEEQIRNLAAGGVAFGSHGHRHIDLTTLSSVQVTDELQTSREILQELTGQPIEYLTYPFGKYNRRVVEIAPEVGFRDALLSEPGKWRPFMRGRIALGRFDSTISIDASLRPGLLSGAQYLKCLIIGSFSHLTPLLQRFKL
ncbi:MAG: polysaccharide deacetylase family protein [candidate division Zixibacteria bacterium]|nr:polysaccharide deacetylase family protein [candidate division Zixibacteria bacterium]